MRRVVSVSLGTSKRDKVNETELLGERFAIERRGTDGDLERFARLFRELDGKVDAFGVGGCDIYVVVGRRRYAFRQIQRLVEAAKVTPIVDGSGLKHTLERSAIERLQDSGTVDFAQERVLLVSAVDRYGMAQALDRVCPNVVYGDLLFGLGLPLPLRSYRQVERVGRLFLPIVTRLPFKWFYPTGKQQEDRRPKHPRAFAEATFLCGDWHYIRRYAPDRLDGKTILTQTLRTADLDWLRAAGARRAITTTPVIGGETFATNVMEAVMITLIGKRPEATTEEDYRAMLDRLSWSPTVIPLNEK